MTNWHERFLKLAEHIAGWSKDPSTQVGAVIVDSARRIISTGYNGLPQGVIDLHDRLHVRETKYEMIVHGEINAILFAKQDLQGSTLYTWPLMPCSRCAGIVIQSGVKTVVAPYNDNPRWAGSFTLSETMFRESGVNLVLL